MKFLVISLMVLGGCKAQVKESETSDPDFAVSKDGTMLVATLGKDKRGFCMLQTSTTNTDERRLLTVEGAISKKQLKKTLRFMGYPEHVFTVLGGSLLGGIAMGAGTAVVGSALAVPALAVGVVALVGGTFGYRIIKGNVEGEKAAPITTQTIFSGFMGSPIVEYFQRRGRLTSVISDKDQLEVTDKKMRKFIERIRDTNPEHIGGCNHLKDLN